MSDDRWRGLDRDELLGLLRRMLEIRLFEDEVQKLFAQEPGAGLDPPLLRAGGRGGRRVLRRSTRATR